jgi:predicted O-methyltransferase YrrM
MNLFAPPCRFKRFLGWKARLAGEISVFNFQRQQDEAARYVAALYRGILRREPDPAGRKHFVKAILTGRSYVSVIEEFINCEEFRAQAKLFVPPGHFFSPIVNTTEASKHLDAIVQDVTEVPGIAVDRAAMVATWRELSPFLKDIPFADNKGGALRYHFDNPAYSWGDGSVLHAMLRYFKPKRLVEIGSGYSSACSLDTIDAYLNGVCEVTFIEPYAALLRELLGATASRVRILEKPVQDVPLDVFQSLAAGDILFIDSTHVLRTGSDVCFELFEILPRLAPGVVVHFHDMFWPFEYPRQWAVDDNRSWNELYAVRAFLTKNDSWRVLFFNDYFAKFERRLVEETFPTFLRNSGGALWVQRC